MEIENRGIRKLVQDGNLEDAIKNLDTLFQDLVKEHEVLATMQSRLARLQQEANQDIESRADLAINRNKITASFLSFFLFLEEKINNVMSIKYDIKNFDEQIKLKMMQQYEVKDKLGEGVSAVIFKARELTTDKEVAIRALKSINSTSIDEEIKGIAKAANIKHRNIIEIVSFNMEDIPYCVVMEYIHGIRLDEMLQIGQFPLRDAIKITIQLCEALYYLQNCGISKYGRLRPSKIIIDQELQPVVSVFEIFKSKGLYQDRSKMGKELLTVRDDLRYVSPEEFFSSDYHYDRDKTDQFMIGMVFYELLTGEPLFKGETLSELIEYQSNFFHRKEVRAKIVKAIHAPNEIKRIVERLFEINPESRFANIRELAKELGKINLHTKPENDIAYESYMRCCIANKNFMEDFYHLFFSTHAELNYKARFANDEVSQVIKKKIQKMVLQIVDFQSDKDVEKLKKIMTFKGHNGLLQSDYANFLNTLKTTVMENDRLWATDSSVEKAWNGLIERCLKVFAS